MSTLFVLLSEPIKLVDLGMDTQGELSEALMEYNCHPFPIGTDGYLAVSNQESSLKALYDLHEVYHAPIVEVTRFII